jgi:hypothetical protein
MTFISHPSTTSKLFHAAPVAIFHIRESACNTSESTTSSTASMASTAVIDSKKHRANLIRQALPSSSLTSPTTLTTFTTATATATSTSISTTTLAASSNPKTKTEIYYPPASSHFALSVPSIIGIVVAGVGFLVLLAIIAAFTVCFLDREEESKAEKKEKRDGKKKEMEEEEKEKMKGKGKARATSVDEEAGSGSGPESASIEPSNANENVDGAPDAPTAAGESVIGLRYAKLIGVDVHNNDPEQSSSATKQKGKETSKRERSMVHLPVHVSDLGTPRQSQMPEYEREDPGDEERDERGFRRGASWWHPEL